MLRDKVQGRYGSPLPAGEAVGRGKTLHGKRVHVVVVTEKVKRYIKLPSIKMKLETVAKGLGC